MSITTLRSLTRPSIWFSCPRSAANEHNKRVHVLEHTHLSFESDPYSCTGPSASNAIAVTPRAAVLVYRRPYYCPTTTERMNCLGGSESSSLNVGRRGTGIHVASISPLASQSRRLFGPTRAMGRGACSQRSSSIVVPALICAWRRCAP